MDFSGDDHPPNEHNPDDFEYSEITVLEPLKFSGFLSLAPD
ncbi:MAG: hypothetical protein ACI8Z1_004044 [Candidatus Azotimanducaceae bacterium]|jgi:hypothetical protein